MSREGTETQKGVSEGIAGPVGGLAWRQEYIPLASIVKLPELQVRTRLDAGAVKRYRDRMAAGGEPPPPITVGSVKGAHYLLDGWHRMEAGALTTEADDFGTGGPKVLVRIAEMSQAEARWEAARANMDHGVPLKSREHRNVLAAFIKARKHRKGRSGLMSYREIAAALGVGRPHTTIRAWIMKDFPALAGQMGGSEGGNPRGAPADMEVVPLAEAHRMEVLKGAAEALQALPLMTPEGRWEVVQEFETVLAEARRLGTKEPQQEADGPVF